MSENTRDRRMKRSVVNSFRFTIRRTAGIAFRTIFVVGETTRTCEGWRADVEHIRYISWMQIAVTEWPTVCEESKRSPDFCAAKHCPLTSVICANYILRTTKQMSKGKLRPLKRKEISAEGNKKRGEKGKKREYAETESAYLRSSHCGPSPHLKSTQFSAIARGSANAKLLRTMCVSSEDSRLFARASQHF